MAHRHYDIAIMGGGIVGRSLAAAIKKDCGLQGLRLALLDAGPPPPSPCPEEHNSKDFILGRVSSINKANVDFLSDISGEYASIIQQWSYPFTHMTVWQGDGVEAAVRFGGELEKGDKNNHISSSMGHIMSNEAILTALHAKLAQCSQDSYDYFPSRRATISGLPPSRKDFFRPLQLTLDDGTIISCNLLVGADGKKSQVRALLRPRIIERDYEEKGIVATVKVTPSHTNMAYQRFLPSGPFALLPLGNSCMSMVWTLSKKKADELLDTTFDASPSRPSSIRLINSALRLHMADVEYFLENPTHLDHDTYQWRLASLGQEERAFGDSLPCVQDILPGSIKAFPLSLSLPLQTVDHRVIMIGDAAHSIHPLAGQGVNLGLEDVRHLLPLLSHAHGLGCDLGDAQLYRSYSRWRLLRVLGMAAATDGIHRIFKSTDTLLHRIAMRQLDRLFFVKVSIFALFYCSLIFNLLEFARLCRPRILSRCVS